MPWWARLAAARQGPVDGPVRRQPADQMFADRLPDGHASGERGAADPAQRLRRRVRSPTCSTGGRPARSGPPVPPEARRPPELPTATQELTAVHDTPMRAADAGRRLAGTTNWRPRWPWSATTPCPLLVPGDRSRGGAHGHAAGTGYPAGAVVVVVPGSGAVAGGAAGAAGAVVDPATVLGDGAVVDVKGRPTRPPWPRAHAMPLRYPTPVGSAVSGPGGAAVGGEGHLSGHVVHDPPPRAR